MLLFCLLNELNEIEIEFFSLQSTQNEKLWTLARFEYDALGERVRIMEIGTYENKSFTFDALLLYRKVPRGGGQQKPKTEESSGRGRDHQALCSSRASCTRSTGPRRPARSRP